jgi:uncharacterized repeat protein (TIGR03847 family)
MARVDIELNPVDHITTDAIGQPGQRVFYLQGIQGARTITLIVEKVQIQTLALGVEEFLVELKGRFPELEDASSDFDENLMRIQPPVDPLFRVGELALGYDGDTDLVIVIAREILDAGSEEPQEGEPAGGEVRYWCTRSQLHAMARWGLEVSGRGRPVCPYCGQPMEPTGHFCPKRNGYKH